MNLLWPLLAVAALAAVVLLALARRRRPREQPPVAAPPPPGDDIRSELAALHGELAGHASPDVMAAYEAIHRRMLAMLWRMGQAAGTSQHVAILRRIAFDYLPRTLRSYLRVVLAGAADHPVAGGRTRPLAGGRTPRQAVLEQLALIDARLADIDDALSSGDVDRLLAHGRFLEVRFEADTEGQRLPASEPGW